MCNQKKMCQWYYVCVILLCVAANGYGATSLNLHDALADFKAILASGQTANMMVFGDSLSCKTDSSYLPRFKTLMQNEYGNAGAGYQGFSVWTGGGFNSGWLKTGINMDMEPHRSLDGLWEESSLAPYPISGLHNTATFTPWSKNIQLQYLQQPGGGSFEIYYRNPETGQLDFTHTINTAASEQTVATWDHRLLDDYEKYSIKPLGDGVVTILGQNNLSDEPGLRIHRAANGGWGVHNFLQRDDTFEQQIDLLTPDLMMVWIGINNGAYTREVMYEQLGLMIDRLQAAAPGAEIVLVTTFDVGSDRLIDRMLGLEDVARDRGLGFINIHETAGTHEFFLDQGYMVEGDVHPTATGGDYFGQFLYEAFMTEGRSLEPMDADANYDDQVGLMDLDILGRHYNMPTGAMWSDGDFNRDGAVSLLDLDILGQHWGESRDIPEPSGLFVMAISSTLVINQRRRWFC